MKQDCFNIVDVSKYLEKTLELELFVLHSTLLVYQVFQWFECFYSMRFGTISLFSTECKNIGHAEHDSWNL